MNIIATLTIGAGDPPGLLLDVRADGHVLNQGTVAPADAIMLARALAAATGDQGSEDALKAMFQPIVDQLAAVVQQGDARQQARKDALAAWEQALASPPPA